MGHIPTQHSVWHHDLDIAPRSVMENYKQTLSSYLDGFNSSSLLIAHEMRNEMKAGKQ